MPSSRWSNRIPCFVAVIAVLAVAHAARGEARAIRGEPFGVGTISLQLPSRMSEAISPWTTIAIEELQGRLYYPAPRSGLFPGASLEEDSIPGAVRISFLFTGDDPLEVTVRTPEPRQVRIVPVSQPGRVHRRHLMRWWRDYNAAVRDQARRGDYPQLIHVYLASMLGNRLGLEPPLLSRGPRSRGSELRQTLELLSGTESLRGDLVREMMSPGASPGGSPNLPVPEEVRWSEPQGPATSDVELEPLARHVPEECFYVRFGNFPNYLWLSHLLRDYGGDIGRMISLRGQDARLNERLQKQLALRESRLAEIFGDQVIADVAILGRDLYLAEGAAMGILFQARNNLALTSDLRQQRGAALRSATHEGASMEELDIAGRQVSFLSTPDNRLRSFHAVDGDFHLVTTSRAIVERFFEAGAGQGALADNGDFQHARRLMPLDRGDTIFAYFSPSFFQSLLGPQYQIELRRRLQSDTAIDLVEFARLAATAEELPNATLEELVTAGLLPRGFGRIADGSGPILERDRTIDSSRGPPGTFTPIPDLPVRSVSRQEADWYQNRAAYFQNLRRMDPLIVGVQRLPGDQPGHERLVLDANISPLAEEKYGWILSLLGPASTQEVTPTTNDIISMQAMVKGGMLAPSIPAHHLILGIKDAPMPTDVRPRGLLQVVQILRETPGYLGAWPKLGFLDLLPLGRAGQPDQAGFSPLPLGAWRWQGGGFSVVSFRHDVLRETVPELQLIPTENPAQIRVKVGDLSRSQLVGFINARNYERARQASVGNVRLLHALSQQLRVPPREARATAERMLDSQLVCALGGDFVYVDRDGSGVWRSTAWPESRSSMPPDYQAPLLEWFRGLRLDLVKSGDRLVMHCELEMRRQENGNNLALPFLNLFGGRKAEEQD